MGVSSPFPSLVSLLPLSFLLLCLALVICADPPPCIPDPSSGVNISTNAYTCFISPNTYTIPFFIITGDASKIYVYGNESGIVTIITDYFELGINVTITTYGFNNDSGPGKGRSSSADYTRGGGASHAGRGAMNYNQNQITYGDFKRPVSLGSGGGSVPGDVGGTGGGAIHIIATTFNNKGIIDSGAAGMAPKNSNFAGGGSGGSILVECDQLLSFGQWSIAGSRYASYGRAALYYNSTIITPDYPGSFTINTVYPASSGTFYLESGTGVKKRELYAIGTGAMPCYDRPQSDYFAATLNGDSPQNYFFDHIDVGGTSKIAFSSPLDSLTVNGSSHLEGTGTVFIAGHLEVSIPILPLSFALLPSSTGTFPTPLSVVSANLFVFGTILQTPESVTVGSPGALYLGVEGNTIGLPRGTYNFSNVYVDSGAYVYTTWYSLPENGTIGTVTIITDYFTLDTGVLSATGQGYPYGAGPGKGIPSTGDLLAGGGGGHGGKGLKWARYPAFTKVDGLSDDDLEVFYGEFDSNTQWGSAYGAYKQPVEPGSGGGRLGMAVTSEGWFTFDPNAEPLQIGCAGGGAIHLISNFFSFSFAVIEADGTDCTTLGTPGASNYCGGGAGGSILLESRNPITPDYNTVIRADGAGLGAGGRIAIYGSSLAQNDGMAFVSGYNIHACGGSAGTVYFGTDEYLLVQNCNHTAIVPGTWGSEEMSAVISLESPTLPSHRIQITNFGSLTFDPQPSATLDPYTVPNITISTKETNPGLLHWNGPISITQPNLYVPIAAHQGSVVSLPPVLNVYAPIFLLEGTVYSDGNQNISIQAGAEMHLGFLGSTEGSGTGVFSFSSIHVFGHLVMRPDFNEEHSLAFPHLQVGYLYVEATATVNSDFLGYRSMRGPIPGYNARNDIDAYLFASSGGHAGRGQSVDYIIYPNKTMPLGYGDVVYPTDMGSGGAPYFAEFLPGGAGGGVVRITVQTLHNKGHIRALGQSTQFNFNRTLAIQVPAGAGGSVWVDCIPPCSIESQGLFRVDGGSNDLHNGAGGRISVQWQSMVLEDFYADGGAAAPGTIFTGYSNPATSYLAVSGDPSNSTIPKYPRTIVSSTLFQGSPYPLANVGVAYASIEVGANNYFDFSTTNISAEHNINSALFISGAVYNATFQTLQVYVLENGVISFANPSLTISGVSVLNIAGEVQGLSSVYVQSAGLLVLNAKGNSAGFEKQHFNFTSLVVDGTLQMIDQVFVVAETILANPNSRIHADFSGSPSGQGISPAFLYSNLTEGICPAAHASASLTGYVADDNGNVAYRGAYGDFTDPTDLGSGGYYPGENGGGLVHLTGKSAYFMGQVSALGGSHASGGSININYQTISGSGSFSACNSDETVFHSNGRVALKATYLFFNGPVCGGTVYYSSLLNNTLHIQPLPSSNPGLDLPVELTSPSYAQIDYLFFGNLNANIYLVNRMINNDGLLGLNVVNPVVDARAYFDNRGYARFSQLEINQVTNYMDLYVDEMQINSGNGVENYGALHGQQLTIALDRQLNLYSHANQSYYSSFQNWSTHDVEPMRPCSLRFDYIDVEGYLTIHGLADEVNLAEVGYFPVQPLRPLISAFSLEIGSQGTISADGAGDPETRIGCFGGANWGDGGGFNASSLSHDADDPTQTGGSGGICPDILDPLPPVSPFLGGGLVYLISGHLVLNGTISANGVNGGAGGTVIVRTSTITASTAAKILVMGSSDTDHNVECGGGGEFAGSYTQVPDPFPTELYFNGPCLPTAPYQPKTGGGGFSVGNFAVVNQMLFWEGAAAMQVQLETISEVNYFIGNFKTRNFPFYFYFSSDGDVAFSPKGYSTCKINVVQTNSASMLTWHITISAWNFTSAGERLQIPIGALLSSGSLDAPVSKTIVYIANAPNISTISYGNTPVHVLDISVDSKSIPQRFGTADPQKQKAILDIPRFANNIQISLGVPIITTLVVPTITSVVPPVTTTNSPIYISGTGFGPVPGAVVLSDVILGPVLSWNDTHVVVVGPSFGVQGAVSIVDASGTTRSYLASIITNKTDYVPVGGSVRCSAWSSGNIIQQNSRKIRIQEVGEFHLAEISSPVLVDIRIRTDFVNDQTVAITAVAVQLDAKVFSFSLPDSLGQPPQFFVDHVQVGTSEDFGDSFANGVSFSYVASPPHARLSHPTGFIEVIVGQGWLGVSVGANSSVTNLGGLCGGASADWFVPSGGCSVVPLTITDQATVDSYVNCFKDTPYQAVNRLFEYTAAKNTSYYYPLASYYANQAFPQVATDNAPYYASCRQILEATGSQMGNICPHVLPSFYYYSMCTFDVSRGGSADPSIVAYVQDCILVTTQNFTVPILPSRTFAHGPGLGSVLIGPNYFFIQPVDAFGNFVTAAPGNFQVSVSGASQVIPTISTANNTIMVNLSYPEGTYEITILYNGFAIYGDPYSVVATATLPTNIPTNISCVSWGGSHFSLFAGTLYSYKGFGEYELVNLGDLVVQVRQAPCGNASCISAVAVRDNAGTSVSFYNISNNLNVYFNNSLVTFPSTTNTYTYDVSSSLSVVHSPYKTSVLIAHAEVGVQFNAGRFDVQVLVATDNSGKPFKTLSGMCGTLTAGLLHANGSHLQSVSPATIRTVSDSWRVSNSTTVFNYGLTHSTYELNNYPEYVNNITTPIFQKTIPQLCTYLQGPLTTSCPTVNASFIYQACLADVSEGNLDSLGISSVVAFSELCILKNSSFVPPVIALHTTATGPGIYASSVKAGQTVSFSIFPVDALGRSAVSSATPFEISFSGPISIDLISVPFTTSSPSYIVSYIAVIPGNYLVSVKLVDGEDIFGSPFSVSVASDPTCICSTGYVCVDGPCQDLNECRLTPPRCTGEFICNNTIGGYDCVGCQNGCNSRGTCVQGVCHCDGGFTGPTCESTSVPVNVTFNDTSPSATITPNQQVAFQVSIVELRELTQTGEVEQRVVLSDLTFFNASQSGSSAIYNTTFPMGGTLSVIFSTSPTSRDISFAGQNFTLAPNSLKFEFFISSWPFHSARNRLALISKNTVNLANTNPCFEPTTSTKSFDDNLAWVTTEFEGTTLYGRFLSSAVLDGRVVGITTTYDASSQEVAIILPHFYDYSDVDPDFSVLIDPDPPTPARNKNAPKNCFKSKKSIHVAAIVVPIVVFAVAVAVAVGYVLYKRHTRSKTMEMIRLASSGSLSHSSSGVELNEMDNRKNFPIVAIDSCKNQILPNINF